jgi:glycosyltransferase involved in cell wall biosynthesis
MKIQPINKVVFVTNIPTPYRVPWWNELNKFVDLQVVFMDRTEKNRKWENVLQKSTFPYEIIQGIHIEFPKRDWTLHANLSILYFLIKAKPRKLILGGYDSITSILALILTKILRIDTILWYESTRESENLNNRFLKKVKRALIGSFGKYAVPGEQAKDNLISLGVAPEKIFMAPNVVNNAYFAQEVQVYKPEKIKLKQELGLPEQVILFVGQLVERKGVLTLLKAYQKLDTDRVGLLIVGDGPLRSQYESYCLEQELHHVRFVGFHDIDSIPQYFAISDVFVLPSKREVWGLVVNEAMASGLPVLCSHNVGCSSNLIHEGINGYTFDPNNSLELAGLLTVMLSDPTQLEAMGEASMAIINQYTIEASVRGIVEALI